jgi:hypothetical protein
MGDMAGGVVTLLGFLLVRMWGWREFGFGG